MKQLKIQKKNSPLLAAVISVILTAALLAGCAAAPAAPDNTVTQPSASVGTENNVTQPAATEDKVPGPIPGMSVENYPRVDGSTANMPLMAQVYSTVCGVSLEEAETAVEVSSGTANAWFGIAYGYADLLLVYEAPQSVQAGIQGILKEENITLESEPMGRDGLVFLVNKDNPVDNLTSEQLRDIYAGKITDWSEVGGTAGPIFPYQRNEDSGSQTMFLKLLMGDTEPMNPPVEWVSGSMGGLIEAVAKYDDAGGAIGFSVYYYANLMYANPNLKLLTVDGVAPNTETIRSGDYPLLNDFFLVIRANEEADSPARLLRDWLRTDDATGLLEEAGYVSAR